MKFAFSLNVGFNKEPYDSLYHSYISYFENLGIVPLLVPNVLNDVQSYLSSIDIQGIVLTGGLDISPELYGEELISGRFYSSARDEIETELLQIALERKLKVLGICRGMQFINVFFGGSLVQQLNSNKSNSVDHIGESHLCKIVDTAIVELFGFTEVLVNSFHNQGVVPHLLAKNFKVFMVSEKDEIIEGILHSYYPIMGIQWHPERLGSTSEFDLQLLQSFFQEVFW